VLVADLDAVAVLVRGDVTALRYALLVEHLVPNVRLVVTLFDRTVSQQLVHVVPNCVVTSPADIAVPSIIGACLGGSVAAVDFTHDVPRVIRRSKNAHVTEPWRPHRSRLRVLVHTARSQLRPHDTTTRILLIGLCGMMLVLLADSLISTRVLHESPAQALLSASRVLATVGSGDAMEAAPTWYLVFSSMTMLLTIGLTALFTAGVVNRVRSSRSFGLIGSRTLPTRDHVVVVGLGQVGLRLCTRLRELGIPVVAVERDPGAINLRLAKQAKVPVLIAHGEDRAVLRRLRLPSARALAAMGADDLDNVEVAIAALAVCPELRVVLRAGEDDIIAETRSLFRIGEVVDVSALTTLAVTLSIAEQQWDTADLVGHEFVDHRHDEPVAASRRSPLHERCDCAPRISLASD